MNKRLLFNILILLIGIGGGYFVGNKMAQKKYEAIAQEEIDSMKDVLKKTKDELSNFKNLETECAQSNKRAEEAAKAMVEDVKGNKDYKNLIRNYAGVSRPASPKSGEEQPPEEEEEDEEDDTGEEFGDEEVRPVIISSDYYYNARELDKNVDRATLFYYRNGDILCEDNEDIIEDIDMVVGYDAIEQLDHQTSVFVYNKKMNSVFQIIAVRGEFGLPENSPKGVLKKMRKDIDE